MLKVLSLFSGLGAFEKALDNLGVDFTLVGFCEIDKWAAKSYAAIHNVPETLNLWDITKVDETVLPKDIDIVTYGFPCQDISVAGKQKGLFNDDGSQTRSGLFFDALRVIEATKPKIAIAENVKNLVGKRFNAQFQVVLASLEAAGYNCYWKVLNAKHFGVPQNRERVFIVSIRKDIDTGLFEFPKPFPLTKRLIDVLEKDVDEKYYLSGEMIAKILENYKRANNGDTLTDKLIQVGQMYPKSGNPQAGRIYDVKGISPALDTCSGGNRMPKVLIALDEQNQYIRTDGCVGTIMTDGSSPKKNNRIIEIGSVFTDTQAKMFTPEGDIKRYIDSDIIDTFGEGQIADISFPNGYNKGNRVFDQCPTINGTTTKHSFCFKESAVPCRIRKLTPRDCFRLMGFDDESFNKVEALHKNTQLYKQAGNSIVVDVLEELFCMMLDQWGNIYV